MTVKQLIGWGSGFRRQYVGPDCKRENELERRLRGYEQKLKSLLKGGDTV